jgi:glycosyltransferase involved in cell wall biosynthesis
MKNKILYIYPNKATFINSDLAFLNKKYNVDTQDLDWGNPKKLVFNLIRQFVFLIKNISKSKAIIINFGGYFSLLPTLFGKLFGIKSLLILNGTDCVSFPSYNYGSLRKQPLKFFIKNSLEFADILLPVDDSLIDQVHTFDDSVSHKNQGIKTFFPNLKTPIQVIPNGFDTSFWQIEEDKIRDGFITVGFVNSKKTYRLKGIDLIIETAIKFPEQKFTIVGLSNEFKETLDDFPSNVHTIPFLKKEDLKNEYQKYLCYLQVSVNEGFGCALVEAVLTGCIPVVSNVGALPNVIKNSGFIINKKKVQDLEEAIQKVLNLNADEKKKLSLKGQKNISENFDISIRERLILQLIEN